ncbi:HD domain-containing protein [Gemmatimonas sp.]|uniref:HD domain-containing protein n=1 Tax=Gemmatimonas sp. TaxID=1962908 RepID=UPI003341AA60
MTRAALALCEAASPPWLVNHCLRAYLWARLLDKRTRSFDDEATYVALLLHDLGLTAQYRLSAASTQQCFTAAGADVAHALATQHGWPDRRAALAAEAIALHLNVTIADRHGPEAWLVRAGSGADIAGLGLHRVHLQDVAAVVRRHPRLEIKREMTAVLATECHAHPNSRITFLVQRLGFNALVRNARMFSE